jgi:hypothetical protein
LVLDQKLLALVKRGSKVPDELPALHPSGLNDLGWGWEPISHAALGLVKHLSQPLQVQRELADVFEKLEVPQIWKVLGGGLKWKQRAAYRPGWT